MPAWMDVVAERHPHHALWPLLRVRRGWGASVARTGAPGLVTAWLLSTVPAPRSYEPLLPPLPRCSWAVSYAALTTVRGPRAAGGGGRSVISMRGPAAAGTRDTPRRRQPRPGTSPTRPLRLRWIRWQAGSIPCTRSTVLRARLPGQAGVFTTFMVAGKIHGETLVLGWVADHPGTPGLGPHHRRGGPRGGRMHGASSSPSHRGVRLWCSRCSACIWPRTMSPGSTCCWSSRPARRNGPPISAWV